MKKKIYWYFLSKPGLTDIYIVILSILVIAYIVSSAVSNFVPVLYSDNAIYSHITWFFTQGEVNKAVHMWWQPLYPFLGSLFYIFIRDVPLSLFYVSVTFGILLFAPVYLLTLELTKSRITAMLAGLLATFQLQNIRSFYSILTENLYVTLLCFSVMFAVYALSRKKLVYAFLYGLVVGVTYIARSDILLSYQLFLVFSLLFFLFKQITKLFFVKIFLISILGFCIAASPYLYFNYQKFGYLNLGAKINAVKNMPAYFSPQKNLTTTFAQDVWSLEEPDYDSAFFNKPFDYYRYRIELWESSLDRFWGYMRLFFERDSLIFIYISLGGFVISMLYFLKYSRMGLFLHFLTVFGFLGSLPFQPGVDFRYGIWVFPFLSIFSAILIMLLDQAILLFFGNFKKTLTINYIKFTLLIFLNLAFLTVYFNMYKNNLSLPPQNSNYKSIHQLVGEYINEQKPRARIMTRRESITYYAKGLIVYIPSSIDLSELKAYAKLYDVDFIVADRDTFPQDSLLWVLNDVKTAPEWLIPVKVWLEGYPKTIIYKVKL